MVERLPCFLGFWAFAMRNVQGWKSESSCWPHVVYVIYACTLHTYSYDFQFYLVLCGCFSLSPSSSPSLSFCFTICLYVYCCFFFNWIWKVA